MNDKRKELIVSAISNGTVIDHIPSENVFKVIKILGLDKTGKQVYFGTNLDSKKYGKKGIIKISDTYFAIEEINKIALVAPSATLIEIRDYEVTRKTNVSIPARIEKIVKCFNPNCITNKEEVSTKFSVIYDENGLMKLSCHYCEKNTSKDNLIFI
ncbi:MAG: aspartate carbamoyltransferase regulatory subunit [Bacteroidetes bacterium HGW-Bacteroidetes-1]|jgi:aspartate carbamoyltransferase regulatory subunit|nr:MAG: aspartate carbamoyltransferase regulatory subunit [Bacteroidetes bacterium HGW-Bacteroidetes-1]